MTDILDISLAVDPDMVVWPGAPRTEFHWRRSMAAGDKSNNSNFSMNAHSGTHVDAPLHFVDGGESVERFPLDVLIGPTHLLDFSGETAVTCEGLEGRWPPFEKVERLLLKTRNSKKGPKKDFERDFCALKETETRWLLEKGIRLIGIDAPSIQCFGDGPVVHQLLLEKNVVILEGLRLSEAAAGRYELLCLPLKLAGLEAAPARVVLRKYP